jgi:hypothetical protein
MSDARATIQPKAAPATTLDEMEGVDVRFLHAVLCQVGLPRSAVQETTFTRSNGRCSVMLQAGAFFDGLRMVPQPLPFGCKPRLTLIHACSEAVKTRRREVEIGHSVRGFLRQLDIDCGGKEMAAFRRQMVALASTHMIIGLKTANGPETIQAPPVDSFRAWMADDEGQRTLWPGVLRLGERFYETLIEHAVPLDPNSIGELKNSALGLDLYTWLAHRLIRERNPAGTFVSWGALHAQFGTEYSDVKDFKRRFIGALQKVTSTYKDAKVGQVRGGILLKSSPPPIARARVVVALPAPKSETIAAAPGPPKPATLPQYVTEDGLNAVRLAAPGWDRQHLLRTWTQWQAGKTPPRDYDSAFLGWVKRFTKGKPPG